MPTFSRRQLLRSGLAVGGTAALGVAGPLAPSSAAFVRSGRGSITHGVASGDVTDRTAIVWGRADQPGRLVARVRMPGGGVRRVIGSVVDARTDFTGKVRLLGLAPGETYEYSVAVETEAGYGEPVSGVLTTAPRDLRDVSFVWTGDTAGQGWGRHVERGMPGYSAMADVDPDFFVHSGDTIYADGPIMESATLRDGTIWRNVVSDGVGKVAETLSEFRGRHRYNMGDYHVQGMNAQVPMYVQWDDHEVVNNWYPGEVLDYDPRYKVENRADVLAGRARQAFTEYYPLDRRRRDTAGKVYGSFSRGPHLDVFMLDMRTFRGANTPNLQPAAGPDTAFLGQEQVDWLVRETSDSRATWKAIMADMPLGLVVPDGTLIEAVANGDNGVPLGREIEIATLLSRLKAAGVTNLVWFTADVHYCAAHTYDPSRAAFTDFDPFWEFVGGPINAGGFGPNALDGTFGPKVEFSSFADYPNQDPTAGKQFFGHSRIDGATGVLTVDLVDISGTVVYSKVLEPS